MRYVKILDVLAHRNVLVLPTLLYRQKVSIDEKHLDPDLMLESLHPWFSPRKHLYLTVTTLPVFPVAHRRVAVRHVKVKPRSAALTMLKRLDKIRFRGPRTRDEFPDLGESPPASDGECNDDPQPKPGAAAAARDMEEVLRDPVSTNIRFLSVPASCLLVPQLSTPRDHP